MSLLMLVLLVLLVAGPGSAAAEEESNSTTEAGPDPTWVCEEVSVQSNLTVEQILGEWFLLELDDGSRNRPEDCCLKISLTRLRDDDANNRSVVNLAAFGYRSTGFRREDYEAFFPRDRPWEFIAPGLGFVFRVHSLSSDGRVLALAMCDARRIVYWMTLGVTEDSLPSDYPPRSSFSARRDANLCQKIARKNSQ